MPNGFGSAGAAWGAGVGGEGGGAVGSGTGGAGVGGTGPGLGPLPPWPVTTISMHPWKRSYVQGFRLYIEIS